MGRRWDEVAAIFEDGGRSVVVLGWTSFNTQMKLGPLEQSNENRRFQGEFAEGRSSEPG